MVFQRVSLRLLTVPILSYRSSTSRSTACPGSPRCPTKPEPILTCGCAGKPWVLKHPSISLCLGGPFRVNTGHLQHHLGKSTGFSRVPFNQHPPRGMLKTWSLEILIIMQVLKLLTLSTLMIHTTNPVY